MKFEWDENKNQINIVKHKVSFDKATTIFSDPNALTIFDNAHSDFEERWVSLGRANDNNLYVIVFKEISDIDGNRIRIISARKANKTEIKTYFEKLN